MEKGGGSCNYTVVRDGRGRYGSYASQGKLEPDFLTAIEDWQ